MSEFKIEKGVPLPQDRSGRNSKNGFVYDLEPGDSVLLPRSAYDRVRGSVNYAKKKFPDRRYTTRVDGESIRLWRLA